MKVYILVLIALGAELQRYAEAYSKCNPKIISKIKKYWNGNPPRNIIDQDDCGCKYLTIATTERYFPKGLKCVYSTYERDQVIVTRVPLKGTPDVKSISIKEVDGTIVLKDGGETIVRYNVYRKNGVSAIYTCNLEGEDSDKTPDGFIKIKEGVEDKVALLEARDVLKDLGIKLKKTYCNRELGLLVVEKKKKKNDKSKKSDSSSSSDSSDESKSSKSSED